MRDDDEHLPKGQSSALQLQWRVLKLIYESGKTTGITFDELTEALAEYEGIVVTKRTVERTVSGLEDEWHLEIDKSKKPFRIRKGKNAKPLSIAGLTLGEASGFVLLERYLKDGLAPTLLRELEPFFMMANSRLKNDKQAISWLDKTRFLQRRQPIPAPVTDPLVLSSVQEALQANEILTFTYCHLRENIHETYRVIPLGLVFREQVIFLAAEIQPLNTHQAPQRRTFKLHRMSAVSRTYEIARVKDPFDLDSFMQQQGLEDIDPPIIDLEVMFFNHEGDFLLERPVPEGWLFEKIGDGKVLLKARLSETRQLRMWLQHFSADVEVLAPLELRKKMASQALRMANLYKGISLNEAGN